MTLKRLFLALVVLVLVAAPAVRADATPTNTTINTTLNTCKFQEVYGNFGSTPYATIRVSGVTESNSSCVIEEESVHWASPTSYSKRAIDSTYYGGPNAFASPVPSPWFQRNGPDGKTAYGAIFCVHTYDFSPDDSTLDYKQYKLSMSFADGASAGSAALLNDNADCDSTIVAGAI